MTVEEALRELGVDAAVGREEIRRAYLRLIKTCKPESDPDGIQRARQAYEVARAEGDLETLAVDSEQRYATQAPATSEPPAGTGVRDAPVSATGRAPSREAVFAGFATAWHAVPRSADPGLRIEIAREAFSRPSCARHRRAGQPGEDVPDHMTIVSTGRRETLMVEQTPGRLTSAQIAASREGAGAAEVPSPRGAAQHHRAGARRRALRRA
ncbi:MAG TPA: hypothetical protein VH328_16515, partial [Burkholderiaceae bacterium]|nr:hypothetical protein [Burkholderiaceae bacterium]